MIIETVALLIVLVGACWIGFLLRDIFSGCDGEMTYDIDGGATRKVEFSGTTMVVTVGRWVLVCGKRAKRVG